MSGHPGAVLCGRGHGAVDHAVQGHGQLLVGHPEVVKGHHFLAARKTPTSYAPGLNGFLNVKTLVGAFNKEKASVGAFSGHCNIS